MIQPHHTNEAAFIHRYGVAPDWDHPRPEHHPFRVELDGSPLLQAMQKRLAEWKAEHGEADATGARLMELLLAEETRARPIQEACTDWLQEVGIPIPDDWDDYEFNTDEDWKGARW